ncbi:cytochrome c-type biogenesis protein CcmH [Chloroflexota bacterium]
MRHKYVLSLLVLVLAILALLPVACTGSDSISGATLVSDVTRELMCQCGTCTEVLIDCDCPVADEMTTLVETKLAQGQSAEQIILYHVNQYGEQVLAL